MSRSDQPFVHGGREPLSANADEALVPGSNASHRASCLDRIDDGCVPPQHLRVVEGVGGKEFRVDISQRDRVRPMPAVHIGGDHRSGCRWNSPPGGAVTSRVEVVVLVEQ